MNNDIKYYPDISMNNHSNNSNDIYVNNKNALNNNFMNENKNRLDLYEDSYADSLVNNGINGMIQSKSKQN